MYFSTLSLVCFVFNSKLLRSDVDRHKKNIFIYCFIEGNFSAFSEECHNSRNWNRKTQTSSSPQYPLHLFIACLDEILEIGLVAQISQFRGLQYFLSGRQVFREIHAWKVESFASYERVRRTLQFWSISILLLGWMRGLFLVQAWEM